MTPRNRPRSAPGPRRATPPAPTLPAYAVMEAGALAPWRRCAFQGRGAGGEGPPRLAVGLSPRKWPSLRIYTGTCKRRPKARQPVDRVAGQRHRAGPVRALSGRGRMRCFHLRGNRESHSAPRSPCGDPGPLRHAALGQCAPRPTVPGGPAARCAASHPEDAGGLGQ